MRTILVLMDTLRRDVLSAYNAQSEVITPHLDEFADASCVFDQHWIGSAPCMPARRDILCGRLNFLERSWGPIEPFDTTLPALLKDAGVFSHITTDHCHYMRLGGENYLQQFTTWDYHRGQEGDPWISSIDDPTNMPETYYGRVRRQYQLNRQQWPNEEDMPSPKTFASAMEWLETNQGKDDFLLMVEAFDPHEPFDVPDTYLDMYEVPELDREYFEIPEYKRVEDTDVDEKALDYLRKRYYALVTMTDAWFGKLIDRLKALDMYDDTLIMVTSDHGYFLGEKEFVGKNIMPCYNELSHLPFIVHFPHDEHAGEHRQELTQAIDIMPTVLDYHNIPVPSEVQGKSLKPLTEDKPAGKPYALFGYHAMAVNITDGKYKYMRAPVPGNQPCFEYAGIPYSIRRILGADAPHAIEMGRFLKRTQFPVYKVPVKGPGIIETLDNPVQYVEDNRLYDLTNDYHEEHNLAAPGPSGEQEGISDLERHYMDLLVQALKDYDAPEEQLQRLGLIS